MTSLSFLDLFKSFSQGNFILYIIGGCFVVSVCVFMERCFYLHKAKINTNRFVLGLHRFIKEGNIVEAIRVCEDCSGTISKIVKSGLLRHDRTKDQIEGAMEVSGLAEISRLEKNTKVLSVIAHITPLIGLLGTVLGFIQAFSEMRQTGLVDISTTRIGEAMGYALVTTAAGLVVAIPTIVGYNYIASRIESLGLEMQATSSEIVDLLLLNKKGYEF